MKTIEITKENAIKAFTESCDDVKKVLRNLFGEDLFKGNDKWMQKWKSFCLQNDISITLPYLNPKNSDEESANAYVMLIHIAREKNEGWKPDWDNRSEYKYYPWFNMESSSGFPVCVCVNGDSRSSLGSRLCYKSEEIAKYAGKQFIKLYKEYFTL
jgi:hypothetical protein